MNYPWLEEYCSQKKGAEKVYKEEWTATTYLVGGKMFAMQGGDKEGAPIITLKLEPTHGEILRTEYTHIIPGYYMNKTHWNSLYLEGDVPDSVLRDMVDKSYDLVFFSLPKKKQKEILEV